MPANGFSVGRDVSLTIFTSSGIIAQGALKAWDAQQLTSEVKQLLITGVQLTAYLPEGWQGTATYARMDHSIDDYFAKAEAGYYAGQSLPSATITETIINPDGSVSIFTYQNVALKLDTPGSWSGNREVDMKIAWMASRRIKMA